MTDQNDVTSRRDERGRWLELPPAMAANKWPKGFTPNPGGRTGLYQEAMKLCKTKSLDAVERLVQLAELNNLDETGKLAPLSRDADPRVVMMAAQWIYERAWGKARDYDPAKDAVEPLASAIDRRSEAMATLTEAFQRVLAAQAPPDDVAVASRSSHPDGDNIWNRDADETPSA